MGNDDGSTIACIGGATVDRRAHLSGQLIPGSSNPVRSTLRPGGVARNVAEALARLGRRASLHSAVGDDEAGRTLESDLRELGVETSGVGRSSRFPTGSYTAVLGRGGRLEFGLAEMEIFETLNPSWAASLAASLADRRFWFLDTNLPARSIGVLLEARPTGSLVLADPVSVAKTDRLSSCLPSIDVLFPDRREAGALSRLPTETVEQVGPAAARIRELGVGTVVVTLGSEGAYVADGDGSRRFAAIPPRGPLRDVSGAGDALAAGYLYACSGGLVDPVRMGLAAASLVLEAGGDLSGLSEDRLLERHLESLEGTS